MPQLHEQLSSAVKPGHTTLVNVMQCPFGDKVLLHLMVGSKTSTGKIKDGNIEGTPQLFRIPQNNQTPKISTRPACKLLSYPLILELANI